MKESSSLIRDGDDEESVESSGTDAITSVIAVSMSLIVIFASSITIIYLWKGEDGFVLKGHHRRCYLGKWNTWT